MEQEVHIAGIVVYTDLPSIPRVQSQIASLPVAEVHAASPDGKLIVTLETDSAKRIVAYMDAIRALPGVLNVVLVYQHAEPLAAVQQELEP
ncbi:MAG TPA: chaperone NapD [Noviherbaspirillum sp.]